MRFETAPLLSATGLSFSTLLLVVSIALTGVDGLETVGTCAATPACQCGPQVDPEAAVEQMTCLQASLTSIPDLSEYTSLTAIRLTDNQIRTVSADAFENQPQLREFRIDGNLLAAFPSDAVKHLSELRVLNVNFNPFKQPQVDLDTFALMDQMEKLWLNSRFNPDLNTGSDNSVPSGLNITFQHLKSMPELRLLHLDSNPLAAVDVAKWGDVEASHFSKLVDLSCLACGFTSIPKFIRFIKQLDVLDLTANNLTTVEPGALPSGLRSLRLSFNPITYLLQDQLPSSLEKLLLVSTPISVIDIGVFDNLPDLKLLELSDGGTPQDTTACSIDSVTGNASCRCAPGLYRSLNGDGCTPCPTHVPGFPDSPCLSAVEGARCNVSCGSFLSSAIQPHPFPTNVQPASATAACRNGVWQHNPLECNNVICAADSPCICQGTIVSCRGANLTAIPGGLLPWVTELDLPNNTITSVPAGSFAGLVKLVRVDLSHNRISQLADHVFDLDAIKQIDLSYNALTRLDSTPFGTKFQLGLLDLSFNDIRAVTSPDVFWQTFDSGEAHHASNEYTALLQMTGNPVVCRHYLLSFPGQEFGRVECDCDMLGTDKLAFCPENMEPYRFACEPTDKQDDISSLEVCDGTANCLPSGIDENVCTGRLNVQSASEQNCLISTAAFAGACEGRGYSCFESLNITVIRGIATVSSATECVREFCPKGYAIVTGRGQLLGAGADYSIRMNNDQLDTNVRVGFGDRPVAVSCSYKYDIESGMPAGAIETVQSTLPFVSSTTDSSGRQGSTSEPPASPGSTSSGSTEVPSGKTGTAMSMGDQAAVVAVVCTLLGIVLVGVAAGLWRVRQRQIAAEAKLFLS